MKFLVAVFLTIAYIQPGHAVDISWEIERGFRYFKYNSDFELHRLAYKAFQETHSRKPVPSELDRLLADATWWSKPLGPKTARWYGRRPQPDVDPLDLLKEWRDKEIIGGRPAGNLELINKLNALGLQSWPFHPARIGWASLLFPTHQKPGDLGKGELEAASNVAVCWNRAAQDHSNCDGKAEEYIRATGYPVILRALADGSTDDRIVEGQCAWTIPATAKFISPKVAASSIEVSCSSDVRVFVPAGTETKIGLTRAGSSAEVSPRIRDDLVVGIGDSFSSGEGNPDFPVKLAWSTNTSADWTANPYTNTDGQTLGPIRASSGDYFAAQWIDRACHRSAYSYQFRTSLHLALDDPSRAVTFLSYACSGAEVNVGLFHPYQGPEYVTNKAKMAPFRRAQLPLFLSELCNSYDGSDVDLIVHEDEELTAIANGTYHFGKLISDAGNKCANGKGFKRPIDLLLLSIGGNDLGFSRWILATIWSEGKLDAFLPVLEPVGSPACAGRKDSCRKTNSAWKLLNARYVLLRQFIDKRLAFSNRGVHPVLLLTYPFPGRNQNGDLCPNGNAGMTVFTRSGLNLCVKRVQNNLAVLETIEDFTERRLNGTIEALARNSDAEGNARPGWIAINTHKSAFSRRGFCASNSRSLSGNIVPAEPTIGCLSGNQSAAIVRGITNMKGGGPANHVVQDTLYFPIGGQNDGRAFFPFDPSFDYQPFSHRTRLVRTMNEVQFIINQVTSANQAAVSGLLSLKASAVFGAFHPTNEGHAIFSDAFASEASEILKKPVPQ